MLRFERYVRELPGTFNFTLGTQWQYKPTNENYKSGTKLIEMLVDVRGG